MKRYSNIYIRDHNEHKEVTISSELKPQIIEAVLERWQFLLNTLADIIHVPSALIMNLNEKNIEVFMANTSEENPFKQGTSEELIYGLYCEAVIGKQELLLLPNALKDSVWRDNNPDVDINMISYLGLPLNWPDGEVFGTVCVLDNKENAYNQDYVDLIFNVKNSIEKDFELLLTQQAIEDKNKELMQANQIKSKFLSLISHDIRGAVGTLNGFLNLIVREFEEFDTEKLKGILYNLSRSAEYTYTTLEGLLSWSKNDMLLIKAHKTEVDIVEIVERVVSYYEQTIKLKSFKINTSFFAGEVRLSFDEKMLETSLRNILSNAFKYTKKHGTIDIRVLSRDDKVVIEVEDNGQGMTEDVRSRLFQYNKNHAIQGTEGESSAGIGLMLVKEFIDKNEASVEVESRLAKGSVFRIII